MDDFVDVDKETEVNLKELNEDLLKDSDRWRKFLVGRDIDTSKLESGIRDIDRTLTRLKSLLGRQGKALDITRGVLDLIPE